MTLRDKSQQLFLFSNTAVSSKTKQTIKSLNWMSTIEGFTVQEAAHADISLHSHFI